MSPATPTNGSTTGHPPREQPGGEANTTRHGDGQGTNTTSESPVASPLNRGRQENWTPTAGDAIKFAKHLNRSPTNPVPKHVT
jgi:hypothetical protein